MFPKDPPVRDPEYRRWLSTLSCAFCGSPPPSEVSHHGNTGGMGLKASDAEALPACRACHRRWHDTGSPHPAWDTLSRHEKRDEFRQLARQRRGRWKKLNNYET